MTVSSLKVQKAMDSGGSIMGVNSLEDSKYLIPSESSSRVLSNSLDRIEKTAESLISINSGEREKAGISEKEVEEAKKIRSLAKTYREAYIDRVTDEFGDEVERFAIIHWPFSKNEIDNWKEWFHKTYIRWFITDEKELKEREKIIKENDGLEQFYALTDRRRIIIDNLNEMKMSFIERALAKIIDWTNKLRQY